jgi:hypothetical protein
MSVPCIVGTGFFRAEDRGAGLRGGLGRRRRYARADDDNVSCQGSGIARYFFGLPSHE